MFKEGQLLSLNHSCCISYSSQFIIIDLFAYNKLLAANTKIHCIVKYFYTGGAALPELISRNNLAVLVFLRYAENCIEVLAPSGYILRIKYNKSWETLDNISRYNSVVREYKYYTANDIPGTIRTNSSSEFKQRVSIDTAFKIVQDVKVVL